MTPIATNIETGPPSSIAPLSRPRAIYAVGLLALIYMLSFIDRQILSIVAEPIKRELHLADWQVGAMTGLAFAVLYTVVGIPIARIAEYADRRKIIAASIAVWSLFTILCGAARTFPLLLLARVGVGVGEAGCTPPAMSLIVDYVSKERRAFAISVYMSGSALGALLGMAIGGLVADQWGWRAAFFVVGAPGLLIALLSLLTLPEPRTLSKVARPAASNSGNTLEVVRVLFRKPTYGLLVAAATFNALILYGMHAFLGSFFFRNHGPALAEMAAGFGLKSAGFLGIVLGFAIGGAAFVGTLLGGWLADRLGRKDDRARLVVPAIGFILSGPIFACAMLTPSLPTAFALIVIPGVLNTLSNGPIYSTVQGVAPPHMRATAAAIMLFIINLIGLGGGPVAIGIVSDVLATSGMGDAAGVRWSLAAFGLLSIPAGICLHLARRTLREDTVS